MKKTILKLGILGLFSVAVMSSCKKEEPTKVSTTTHQSGGMRTMSGSDTAGLAALLAADSVDVDKITFQYYSNGQSSNPITDLEDKFPVYSAVRNTATRSAVITIRTFSSEANYLAWGDANGYEFTGVKRAQDSIRAKGTQLGYQINAEPTAELGSNILNYSNSTAIPSIVGLAFAGSFIGYDDLIESTPSSVFPLAIHPRLFAWNNELGSVKGYSTISVFMFFDKGFFGKHMATFAGWGFSVISFHPAFGLAHVNNRTTSYMHFALI